MSGYVVNTPSEQKEMLQTMGMESLDDLYVSVPEQARLKELHIPEGKSEFEVSRDMQSKADKNMVYKHIFRGAGAYNHYIPAIVKSITSKEEFLTAYTPYQAEISQGVLQSIFEYQTQMCELTGLDVSNASVYDGAVAAAEAIFMVQERKRSDVLIADTINPQIRTVIETYCESRNVNLITVKSNQLSMNLDDLKEKLNDTVAGVLVQSPNFYGIIEDVTAISALAHEHKVKVIMQTNPIALAVLKNARECNADICVAEGQPLGLPLGYGGPYLGIMTATKDMMRKLPGRIVGETTDHNGNRAYVLTLQAREQHIRREKASSNICSNEALCAMTASVYCAAVGPKGLKQVACNSASNAHYLASELKKIEGFELVSDKEFFNEFLMTCPVNPNTLIKKLSLRGILGGLPVGDNILWCCTEMNTKQEMDQLVNTIREVL